MVLILSAIACTGGSPWQNINKLLLGGEEIIPKHLKMFNALWKKLVNFVDWLNTLWNSLRICIEWPDNCAYWNWREVRSFLYKWDLQEVCFDGCAIGLKARSGELLRKPGRVCTNDL